MAASVKLVGKPNNPGLTDHVDQAVGSIAKILSKDQVQAFEQSANLIFRLVALAVQEHDKADLTEDQQSDLDTAKAALKTIGQDQESKESALILSYYTRASELMAKAKPDQFGKIAVKLESEKAKALADLGAQFEAVRSEHEETIKALSNIKGEASKIAIWNLFSYNGTGSATGKSGRISMEGNAFYVGDLGVENRSDYKLHAFYRDGILYVWPYGKEVSKIGPKLARETWIKIGKVSPTSPTALQALVWDLINRYTERSSPEDILERMVNMLEKGTLPDRVGGSRNVSHVVDTVSDDTGYTRQVAWASLRETFKTLPGDPDPEPDPDPAK